MSPKFSPFVNLLIWKLHKICLLYSNFTKTTLDDVPSSCAFVDCILHNHVFIFFVYMFIRVTLYLVVAVSMTFINTFGISIDAYNIKEIIIIYIFRQSRNSWRSIAVVLTPISETPFISSIEQLPYNAEI